MFFDTENEKVLESGFEALPSGWYRVLVESAQTKTTQKGTGRYVSTVLSSLEAGSKGRKFFENFNISNPSEIAQRIGRSSFKKLLNACGITSALQTEVEMQSKLSNKTCYALIGVRKKTDGSGEQENFIKDYSDQPKGEVPHAAGTAKASTGLDDIPF